MYLWHMFVLHFVALALARGMPAALCFPVTLIATLAVAEFSYRLYEAPFLKLKRRFAR